MLGPVGKRAATAGDLYVLAVGINKFPLLKRPDGGSVDLQFAARDADELARLRAGGGGTSRPYTPGVSRTSR